jgi:hypothetical protein
MKLHNIQLSFPSFKIQILFSASCHQKPLMNVLPLIRNCHAHPVQRAKLRSVKGKDKRSEISESSRSQNLIGS